MRKLKRRQARETKRITPCELRKSRICAANSAAGGSAPSPPKNKKQRIIGESLFDASVKISAGLSGFDVIPVPRFFRIVLETMFSGMGNEPVEQCGIIVKIDVDGSAALMLAVARRRSFLRIAFPVDEKLNLPSVVFLFSVQFQFSGHSFTSQNSKLKLIMSWELEVMQSQRSLPKYR